MVNKLMCIQEHPKRTFFGPNQNPTRSDLFCVENK